MQLALAIGLLATVRALIASGRVIQSAISATSWQRRLLPMRLQVVYSLHRDM
ncbi:hypothetical protein THTE_4417 [Thermogutta terrifontis]|uniref:Uncharacterized protein n=1 Tax=Thermogutta terrifontis TaxID=1331910 RepID=A0A286RM27_9BACT|nr:hypothetical protein THTE_4417 [Thermogutta terrifontis]